MCVVAVDGYYSSWFKIDYVLRVVDKHIGVRLEGLGSNPGEGMDVCRCIVPSRHGGILNSRRAKSPLMRLVEEEERWEALDHSQDVLPQNWGGIEQNRTVTYMVLKAMANDRRCVLKHLEENNELPSLLLKNEDRPLRSCKLATLVARRALGSVISLATVLFAQRGPADRLDRRAFGFASAAPCHPNRPWVLGGRDSLLMYRLRRQGIVWNSL
ncbi:uncharacterized protein TNCV_4386071 [Trichonephila clavipes]|nr:uncharacterized protein TNCV_4386071 [Trichonephila clavipes]